MDEQYIQEQKDKELKQLTQSPKVNNHKNIGIAVVIVIIMATLFTFFAKYDFSQEKNIVPVDSLEEQQKTDTGGLAPSEESISNNTDSVVVPPGPSLPTISANTPGAVSCFDYYNFGSVQVDVSSYRTEYSNADPILFGGEIKNQNPYPVVDGQIYMKIFKLEQASDEFLQENGYPMVDFVLVKDKINLPASSTMPMDFEWNVPQDVASGDYQVAFFFTTAHRYNLLGLSFTDDVIGNTSFFKIIRDTEYNPVSLDKNKVHLNDTRFSFALPPRHFGANEQVVAYSTLNNTSKEKRTVEVIWTIYKWDGILESNKISTETQYFDIKPNSEMEISYETPVLDTSVTFIQLEAKDGDSKSIQHIRYIRNGVVETRINYPSLYSYPLKAGEEATLFSCIHSTNEPVVPDNVLELTLTDEKGNVIHSYTYEGDITGEMMGVKDTFIPEKDLVNVSLNAKLTEGGKTVEEVTIDYNCEDIDQSLCVTELAAPTTYQPVEEGRDKTFIITFTILLLLITVGGGYLYLRNEKSLISDKK